MECERCGVLPKRIEAGPFAGQRGGFDYCEWCSMNLCDGCMREGRCKESEEGTHKPNDDI